MSPASPLTVARFRALAREFTNKRLLVLGDLMLDEYLWGEVRRLSPEAPVPIVEVMRETHYPGGAANVARNLRQFAQVVHACGRIGADEPGRQLREALTREGIATEGLIEDATVCTTVKTRVVARQQIVRVDRERRTPLDHEATERMAEALTRLVPQVDAVVVSDYHKGLLGQALADHVTVLTAKHDVLLAVDPNPGNPLQWPGATVIKPNRAEALAAAGMSIDDQRDAGRVEELLRQAGEKLLAQWGPKLLLMTLGERGMLLMGRDTAVYRTPARPRAVFDVSGAGDTAISLFTLALTAGATAAEAAEMANCASSIVVAKLGTATTDVEEMAQFLGSVRE